MFNPIEQMAQKNPMIARAWQQIQAQHPQILQQMQQNNSQMMQTFQNMQGRSPVQLQQMAYNLAQARGINLPTFAQQLGMRLPPM